MRPLTAAPATALRTVEGETAGGEKKKLSLDDLQVQTFATDLDEEELAQIEAVGGCSYGVSCYATRSYNCYSICACNKDV